MESPQAWCQTADFDPPQHTKDDRRSYDTKRHALHRFWSGDDFRNSNAPPADDRTRLVFKYTRAFILVRLPRTRLVFKYTPAFRRARLF